MTGSVCVRCKSEIPASDRFQPSGRKYSYCRECRNIVHKEWRDKNEELVRQKGREAYWRNRDVQLASKAERGRRNRVRVIDHYGGCCACCGILDFEFLAVDHIAGGGGRHKRELGIARIADWIVKNNFPEGFRILCHNCNTSLGHYGYCPHDKERELMNE